MLLTLKILFQSESTEGVDENQTTAVKVKEDEKGSHGERKKSGSGEMDAAGH